MNTRRAVFLVVSFSSLCLALLLLRSHLRDLVEVGRTYSTFHRYIHQHPDILFRYNQSAAASKHPPQVPKHLHHIRLQEDRSPTLEEWLPAMESCTALHHPNWTHSLWTDANSTSFIATHRPSLLPHYRSYRQPIQRANVLRYALLHHFGGVYLDLDVTCRRPLDDLLHLPFLTPGAHPAGQNNAFILARAGHPVLGEVLDAAPSRDLWWPLPYVENMLSTGCMFLSNRWMAYERGLARRGGMESSERVYLLADEQGELEPHMLRGVVETPLFVHGGASGWHGWDAAAIIFVGEHYRLIVVLSVALMALMAKVCLFRIWKLVTRQGPGRRSRQKGVEEDDTEKRVLQ